MGNTDVASRLVWQNMNERGLGQLTLAGFIQNSAGIGWEKMRVLGKYALVYVHDGGGIYKDARGVELAVRAGDLLVVHPDVPHCYGPAPGTQATWSEFYIVFAGPVFDAWRRAGELAHPRVRLALNPVAFWLQRLHDVVAADADNLRQIGRLQLFMADAFAAARAAAMQEDETAWLERARELLAQPKHWRSGVPALAEKLGTPYETFRKRFAALAGQSPAKFRMQQIVQHACRLLHEPAMSNAEVAATCGFCDEFHFSRRFKQVMGVSPSGFRRMLPMGATKKPAPKARALKA